MLVLGGGLCYNSNEMDEKKPDKNQMINMSKAEKHNEVLQKLLAQDDRFQDVRLGVGTGSCGSIMVLGKVDNEETVKALKQLISGSNPPVYVEYLVTLKITGKLAR